MIPFKVSIFDTIGEEGSIANADPIETPTRSIPLGSYRITSSRVLSPSRSIPLIDQMVSLPGASVTCIGCGAMRGLAGKEYPEEGVIFCSCEFPWGLGGGAGGGVGCCG